MSHVTDEIGVDDPTKAVAVDDPAPPGPPPEGPLTFNQVVQDPGLLEQYTRRFETTEEYHLIRGVAGAALVQNPDGELELKFWIRGKRIEHDPELVELIFSALDLKYKISMFNAQTLSMRPVGLRRLYALFSFVLSTLFGDVGEPAAQHVVVSVSSRRRRRPLASLGKVPVSLFGLLAPSGAGQTPASDDHRVRPSAADSRFKATIREEIDSIRRLYQQTMDGTFETKYTSGMFVGFGMMLSTTILLAMTVPTLVRWLFGASVSGTSFQAFLVTMLSGSLGAVLSVMIQMSRQKLTLRSDVHPRRLFLFGLLRPTVGSLFGMAIYVLILAGMLPLSRNAQTELALAAALGFLAGFSERWARDVVTSAADQVTATTATQPSG
jgi:hypothetical protein